MLAYWLGWYCPTVPMFSSQTCVCVMDIDLPCLCFLLYLPHKRVYVLWMLISRACVRTCARARARVYVCVCVTYVCVMDVDLPCFRVYLCVCVCVG
jgi:hypothetical protein